MKSISVTAFEEVIKRDKDNSAIAFIDVCSASEHKSKHIEGVKNIPLDELPSRMRELADKKIVYIHCRSGNRSKRAIEELQRRGIQAELINVEGGISAWESAGLTIHANKASLPLMQQVFIVAGTCILIGIALTLWKGTMFLIIPAIVGIGLVFAGVTGWCGMAMILSKMPWNR